MAGAFPIAINSSLTTPAPPAPPPGVVIAVGTVIAGPGMQPVATVLDDLTPHGNPHVQPLCQAGPFIASSLTPTVFVNNLPVATVGAMCSCGHEIATGVPTVLVGTGG
jgi:uncharacterized Zn-binding protein involved in type VI secretion